MGFISIVGDAGRGPCDKRGLFTLTINTDFNPSSGHKHLLTVALQKGLL